MGKSTISMAIFNSKLLVHQRVSQKLTHSKAVQPISSMGDPDDRWLLIEFDDVRCVFQHLNIHRGLTVSGLTRCLFANLPVFFLVIYIPTSRTEKKTYWARNPRPSAPWTGSLRSPQKSPANWQQKSWNWLRSPYVQLMSKYVDICICRYMFIYVVNHGKSQSGIIWIIGYV